mgnify:CR=1 FL=1
MNSTTTHSKQRATITLAMMAAALLLLSGCSASNKPSDEDQLKRAKLHYQLGLDALYRDQLPKAFEEFMLAEEIDPDLPEVLDGLGYAWRLRGNLEKSESYYKRALRAGAGSATHNNYGSLLLQMKKFDQAKVQLKKALEDPRYRNQFMAYINLGDAYLGSDEFDEAIRTYRKAGRFGLNQTLSRMKEAEAHVAYNQLNYAQALYEEIFKEQPANRSAIEGLVNVLKLRNDRNTARQRLSIFMEQPSISALDRAWAADTMIRLNRP